MQASLNPSNHILPERPWVCHLRDFSLGFLFYLFVVKTSILSHLHTQCGARTHDPKIQSYMF